MPIRPLVGVIMGSDSDLPTMKEAAAVLEDFGVPYELRVTSAHRTPRWMAAYATSARRRGIRVLIAGAGGAAHLPGMAASYTTLPVIGVPIRTAALDGLDALLSIAQMPAGIPVATVAIGNAKNAGLLAVRILAASRPGLRRALERAARSMARTSLRKDVTVRRSTRPGQRSA
jgi:5-(carboxyamino)imidazole ribonucleotide mutase